MKKNDRSKDALSSKFSSENFQTLIIKSSSDIGVRRNLGRNGARYAPEQLIQVLKKMHHHSFTNLPIHQVEVSNQNREKENFEKAQRIEGDAIANKLCKNMDKKIVHLGGGHDHVLPLLQAIEAQEEVTHITIINIDAHCDTRIDEEKHSGTPFRNFDAVLKKQAELIQFGIHSYSNSEDTMLALKNIPMSILGSNYSELQEKIKGIPESSTVLLSIDADAMSSSQVQAVSAVNHNGLDIDLIRQLIRELKSKSNKLIFGLYEYNPVFDDLSQKSARHLCSLIYEYLKVE